MVLAGVIIGLQYSSKSWFDLKQIIVTLYIGMIVQAGCVLTLPVFNVLWCIKTTVVLVLYCVQCIALMWQEAGTGRTPGKLLQHW